jgi:exosortase/archaeosortase family protein
MKRAKMNNKKESTSVSAHGVSVKRFVITYLILVGAFYFLIWYVPLHKVLDVNGVYTKGVVVATSKLLGLIGVPCTHSGSIINLPSMGLDVKFGCNGLEAVMIYSVAVVAFPAAWKKRLLGLFAGFVILQIVNVLRIAALAFSALHYRNLFEYIHVYVAQGIMIAVALGVFFLYLNHVQNEDSASA